ncbi:hypothetical protein M0805_007081 [Coniferiporia weirii]|nr:hypothetical protein M0805_007081 [Coniferiporia weirii]
MDIYTDDTSYGDDSLALSYDDATTYEEQVAALPVEKGRRSRATELASRITNRVYLPPESLSKAKRKRDEDEEDEEEANLDDAAMDGVAAPNDLRPNGLYLNGSPVANLPTNHVFSYARHYNTEPVGLEWIDDKSCVLIFATNAACQAALNILRKLPTEEPDFDDCYTAKPIPVALWPPEKCIIESLGVRVDRSGTLLVRTARVEDKKTRGAKNRSIFYQKHGMDAGKDPNAHAVGHNVDDERARKRQRQGPLDEEERRRELDAELEDFLKDGSDEEKGSPTPPPSPPSKMRSDYIVEPARREKRTLSLLERTSLIRVHPGAEEFSHNEDRSRRTGRGRRAGRRVEDEERPIRSLPRRRRGGADAEGLKRAERPNKTRRELDDELDAFLNEQG